jgi:hypothetical protein
MILFLLQNSVWIYRVHVCRYFYMIYAVCLLISSSVHMSKCDDLRVQLLRAWGLVGLAIRLLGRLDLAVEVGG